MARTGNIEPSFLPWCMHHKCQLIENEHYDDWMWFADFSGFYCPQSGSGDDFTEAEKCEFGIIKISEPNVNILNR